MPPHRIFQTSFASVYPLTLAKLENKGRTRAELDARSTFEQFFAPALALNPARQGITGTICGVRIEAIEESLMRYFDKLVDELAKGRGMGKALREG